MNLWFIWSAYYHFNYECNSRNYLTRLLYFIAFYNGTLTFHNNPHKCLWEVQNGSDNYYLLFHDIFTNQIEKGTLQSTI